MPQTSLDYLLLRKNRRIYIYLCVFKYCVFVVFSATSQGLFFGKHLLIMYTLRYQIPINIATPHKKGLGTLACKGKLTMQTTTDNATTNRLRRFLSPKLEEGFKIDPYNTGLFLLGERLEKGAFFRIIHGKNQT